jgi:hypothetical protein
MEFRSVIISIAQTRRKRAQFPFVIFHFTVVIFRLARAEANDGWKMGNGK